MKEQQCIYVGVDVAKDHLDVFHQNGRKVVRIANSIKAITDWIAKQNASDIHVVMEATGGYETLLVDALHEADIPCSAVNAKRIKDLSLIHL